MLACTAHPDVSPWVDDGDRLDAGVDRQRPYTAEFPDLGAASWLPHSICGAKKFSLARGGQIVLVLDRSSSMSGNWANVTSSLIDIVTETQGRVMWGLISFPVSGGAACAVSDKLEVPLQANNLMALTEAMTKLKPGGSGGGSPLRMAIRRATEQLQALPDNRPRYLVVATDGSPNCRNDMAGAQLDVEPVVKSIQDAAALGFHTFVVGVAADTASEGVLSDIAAYGLEPQPGNKKYYAVQNKKELTAVLQLIAQRLQDCVYPLDRVPPGKTIVEVEGQLLPQDPSHADGWDYLPGNTSVKIYGPTCQRLMREDLSTSEVNVIFGCPEPLIP
jgi:hypothetical protein